MRSKKIILLACVLALIAAGCSKGTGTHWRKAQTDSVFLIRVFIPAFSIDPAIGNDNRGSATFNSAVDNAIAQWNAHPDLRVQRATVPCDSHHTTPNAVNCLSAYRVTQAFMDGIYPSFPPGSAIGSAQWWQNSEHIFNSGADPDAQTWTRFLISVNIEDEPATLANATCHELGHDLGLNHADMYDSNGDGTPDTQPTGPCVDAVPDRSAEYVSASGTGTAGYDVDNIEIEYNTCLSDGSAATTPGASSEGGDDPCGALRSAQSAGSAGTAVQKSAVDTRASLQEAA